jgi:hypothetical protein
MTGHGSQLRRKMEQVVVALLSARSTEEAAKSAGVSARTLLRATRRWRSKRDGRITSRIRRGKALRRRKVNRS